MANITHLQSPGEEGEVMVLFAGTASSSGPEMSSSPEAFSPSMPGLSSRNNYPTGQEKSTTQSLTLSMNSRDKMRNSSTSSDSLSPSILESTSQLILAGQNKSTTQTPSVPSHNKMRHLSTPSDSPPTVFPSSTLESVFRFHNYSL